MACLAGLRESGLSMVGIGRFLEVRQVTSRARCRSAGKFSALMAGGAFENLVRSSQIKAGLLQVVEFGIQPGVGVVALFARRREAAGHVTGLRALVILGVA